ncbi:S-protein homolog 21 [Eutrema salsugineum]|nr:S-protein homolog 21 [Eutrema salsugineum]
MIKEHNKLRVHCRSKDDDLGFHDLNETEIYDFSFREHVFATTLFWCNVWKGPDFNKHHQSFEAFSSDTQWKLLCGGKICKWVVRDDAIYVFNTRTKYYAYVYAWDVPHGNTHMITSST